MTQIKQALARLLGHEPAKGGQLVVVRPALPAGRLAPPTPPIVRPTVVQHYTDSVKQRAHMRIERKLANAAVPTLRIMTEQAKLAVEYQNALNALSFAEVEREVRVAELEQKKLELSGQKREHQQLEQLRLQKAKLALQVDIAMFRRQIKEQRRPPEPKLTPAQQKGQKKAEIEGQLQHLRAEEAKAIPRGTSELEKRRLQNMYANRRERLMEELEKYL